ncbi:hypothetical protein BDR07DRAFT_1382197 [Suillus spraguei]|nr:hypothetical protein BDR07DRAFT_1382197 [Suillus spraguei]
MCPFRNCGWVYLEQMQEILPVGGARGVGAFQATDVPVPSTNDEPDVDATGVQAPGSSSSMSGDVIMSGANAPPPLSMPPLSGTPIMSGINAPPLLSMTPPSGTPTRPTFSTICSTGKCSHDASSMFQDDATTFTSTVPSSDQPQPSQPASKIQKSQTGWSQTGWSQTGWSQTGQLCAGQLREDSSCLMTSAARAAKITPAAAVMGMQGSINRLTDVIERGMVTDVERLEKQRHTALNLLNGEDMDLYPLQERVNVMHMFSDDPAVTDTYLQTDDRDTRYAFIQHMLQYRFQKNPQAPQVPYVRPQLL